MRKFTNILGLVISLNLLAQEAQFSQYYAASLYLNPGFNGIYDDAAIHINHKRQLQTVDVLNELTQISFIFPIKPKASLERSLGGVGLMAFEERSGFQGIYQRRSVFLNYAHNLKFGLLNSYLISVGIQGGYEIRQISFSGLTWPSQYNPWFGLDDSRPIPDVSEFDDQEQNFIINAGIMYYYNPERNYLLYKYSGFVGLSATNLNRPNTSFFVGSEDSDPVLYKYNGGIEIKMNKLFVTPSLLFMYLARNYQFNAGLNMAWVPEADQFSASGTQLLFGTWYRFRDSFIVMGGVQVSRMAIRVSYDFNSKLFLPQNTVDFVQNSMEVSIQYSLSSGSGLKGTSNPLF